MCDVYVVQVAVVKSVATQNKKQEVAVKKQEMAVKTKVKKTEVRVAKRRDPRINKDSLPYLPYDDDDHDDHDHSEHDDNDDDDDYIIRATGKPSMRLAPMGRPVTMATGRLATTTTRRPMARWPGRAVVTFPRRHSIMESLPAGCLLSESLIACGSTGMVHIPILSDQGVKTLYLAGEEIQRSHMLLTGTISRVKRGNKNLSSGLLKWVTMFNKLEFREGKGFTVVCFNAIKCPLRCLHSCIYKHILYTKILHKH